MKHFNIYTISKSAGETRRFIPLLVFLCLVWSGAPLSAADPTAVKQLAEKTVDTGLDAQQNHESWVAEERRLVEEIEGFEHKLEHVQWQRKKLAVNREGIAEKISELEKKAEAMEAVNQELLPILEKNLEVLKKSLATDLPCNMSERRKSLIHAQTVLNDYDMGLLDKTRAVLDSIAREVDMGHHVTVLEDEIEVDGAARRVKMLQVGRVGLYAITLDSERAFYWNVDSSNWQEIDKNAGDIQEAIEMAEGIRLVGLSNLPMTGPVQQLEGQQ